MFEFSNPRAKNVGFRAATTERLSRLFEASAVGNHALGVSRSELQCELRAPSSEPVPGQSLRQKLRFVDARSVSIEKSGLPRLSASRTEDLKSMLVRMASKAKRAAAAQVFHRFGGRLAPAISPRSVAAVESSSSASSRVRRLH